MAPTNLPTETVVETLLEPATTPAGRMAQRSLQDGSPGPYPPTELTGLARRYRQAAGAAFAEGKDELAATYRAASEELTALAERLPALPRATR